MTRRRAGGPKSGTAGRDPGAEADDALFERTMAGVLPLTRKRRPLAPTPDEAPAPAVPVRPTAARSHATSIPREMPGPREPTPLSADSFAGVDRRTVDRLRRGKLPIEARLDLHGNYQDAAHAELNHFIAASAAAGRRVVLVITGKGSVGEGGGVLRRRLPDWLNQPACRPHVLAFAGARPEHGGGGAFYVLLRRQRERRR